MTFPKHDFNIEEPENIVDIRENKGNYTITIKQDIKLGDVLNEIPYGVVNKSITGIGATTLELKSKRKSIIVVPTKALAFGKYIRKPKEYFYVGSPIENKVRTNYKEVTTYAKRENINQKFIVVADSLPRLINVLTKAGINVYEEYFIMVDEVDIIQYDVTYRPALEDAIDYYLKFNPKKRCLVSATMREFSHPVLQKERLTTITYPILPDRLIEAVRTNNINYAVCEKISELINADTGKILVAYNYISEIHEVIKFLQIKHLDITFGILCSSASEISAGEFYTSLVDDKLVNKVTFITCAYFVGVDILEACHIVSVSSVYKPFTLLSFDKLTQIRGRCREGALSESFIFNVNSINKNIDINQFKSYLIAKSKDVKELYHLIDKMSDKPQIVQLFDLVKSAIQEKLTAKIIGEDAVPLSRKDIDGNYLESFFNIDALIERKNLKHNIYTKEKTVLQMLKSNNAKYSYHYKNYDFTEEQKSISDEVNQIQTDKILAKINKSKTSIDKYVLNYKEVRTISKEERLNNAKEQIELANKALKMSEFAEQIEELNEIIRRNTSQIEEIENPKPKSDLISTSLGEKSIHDIFDFQLSDLYHIYEHEELNTRTISFYNYIFLFRKYYPISYVTKIAMHLAMESKRKQDNTQRAVIFHAMDDNFPFKQMIVSEFIIGNSYTPDEIKNKLTHIYSNYPTPICPPKDKILMEHFTSFVKAIRSTDRKTYKVIGFNPKDLPVPISKITLDKWINIYELMKFN